MSQIHPTAIVEDGAQLADDVIIGPYCTIGPNVKLGHATKLISHVVIAGNTTIGKNSEIHPFAVLGHPPQHNQYKGEDVRLTIGDNVIIREHVTMHPGTTMGNSETKIGDNGLFMVGAHVAHDCLLGNNVIFSNNATLGGHVTIGDHVIVGGLAALHQFTRVGNHAFIGGMAAVPHDVIPYGSVHGNHAHLAGLNIVGLKRRGFTRDQIHDLRSAYRLLFAWEGTFQERIEDVSKEYQHCPEVMEIIDFIRSGSNRSICMPTFEQD